MRISVYPDDPGWPNHHAHQFSGIKVFFEGAEIKCVFTADEEARYVVVAALDAQGHMQVDRSTNDVKTEIRHGHVRIETYDARGEA